MRQRLFPDRFTTVTFWSTNKHIHNLCTSLQEKKCHIDRIFVKVKEAHVKHIYRPAAAFYTTMTDETQRSKQQQPGNLVPLFFGLLPESRPACSYWLRCKRQILKQASTITILFTFKVLHFILKKDPESILSVCTLAFLTAYTKLSCKLDRDWHQIFKEQTEIFHLE